MVSRVGFTTAWWWRRQRLWFVLSIHSTPSDSQSPSQPAIQSVSQSNNAEPSERAKQRPALCACVSASIYLYIHPAVCLTADTVDFSRRCRFWRIRNWETVFPWLTFCPRLLRNAGRSTADRAHLCTHFDPLFRSNRVRALLLSLLGIFFAPRSHPPSVAQAA